MPTSVTLAARYSALSPTVLASLPRARRGRWKMKAFLPKKRPLTPERKPTVSGDG